MSDSESKADGLNYAEIRTRAIARDEGGSPKKPIRKRGRWRAIRRGELWALMEVEMENFMHKLMNDLNRSFFS